MFLLISSKLLSISGVFGGMKTLNLSQSAGEFTIKLYSSRLNMRLYNKLSKEVEDFRDSEDEYTYTRHQIPIERCKTNVCLRKYT